jgi:hypothetical protein
VKQKSFEKSNVRKNIYIQRAGVQVTVLTCWEAAFRGWGGGRWLCQHVSIGTGSLHPKEVHILASRSQPAREQPCSPPERIIWLLPFNQGPADCCFGSVLPGRACSFLSVFFYPGLLVRTLPSQEPAGSHPSSSGVRKPSALLRTREADVGSRAWAPQLLSTTCP